MSRAHRLVDTASALEVCAQELRAELATTKAHGSLRRLFIDTEFESNRSGTRLCLLQITAGATIYLVDPLALKHVSPLAALLADPDVEWVLHAGLQDVELVTKHFDIKAPHRLFDTQIAWGLISPEASVSLAYLTYKLLQIRSEKSHQTDDWMRRPLQESQLRYAAGDVLHLTRIQDLLIEAANKLDRTEYIYQASSETLLPPRSPRTLINLASFRNAWQLSPPKQAALKFIIEWYNRLSPKAQRHTPDSKVLLSVASSAPTTLSALSRIKGVSQSFVETHGRTLIDGMTRAAASCHDDDFELLDPAPYATYEEIQLEAWLGQWRAHLAVQLKFAPELVLPGRIMRDIKINLETKGKTALHDALVGYRNALLIEESTAFCAAHPPPV